MKKYLYICYTLIALVAALTCYFASQNTTDNTQKTLSKSQILLIKIGEKCVDFGERAVANNTPIIAFQQLEREAKRTNVIQRCMTDNGYQQNPAWAAYVQPLIKADADKNKISTDEALANISRKHLQVFTLVVDQPSYWLKK